MPSKTKRQARAMRAAAAGRSTLGIPKEVGKEFVKADQYKANIGGNIMKKKGGKGKSGGRKKKY